MSLYNWMMNREDEIDLGVNVRQHSGNCVDIGLFVK